MRRSVVLVAVLAALGLGAGCGSESESEPVAAPPGSTGPREPCASQPPGRVADGVNDDQGGSRPGTDPCAGE